MKNRSNSFLVLICSLLLVVACQKEEIHLSIDRVEGDFYVEGYIKDSTNCPIPELEVVFSDGCPEGFSVYSSVFGPFPRYPIKTKTDENGFYRIRLSKKDLAEAFSNNKRIKFTLIIYYPCRRIGLPEKRERLDLKLEMDNSKIEKNIITEKGIKFTVLKQDRKGLSYTDDPDAKMVVFLKYGNHGNYFGSISGQERLSSSLDTVINKIPVTKRYEYIVHWKVVGKNHADIYEQRDTIYEELNRDYTHIIEY